jgi:pimeloyl-ACP methyl ester carboxylesterase
MLSAAYQRAGEARDSRRYPPPGAMVDIGGRHLHVVDHGGTGVPVVVETGSGALARGWDDIAPRITEFARFVTYDRAGYGWSDEGRWRTTGTDVAGDLCGLLAALRIDGPYVLVGHSLGGLYVRSFLDAYPDQVAGIVLVDSSHEAMLPRIREQIGDAVIAAQLAASVAMTAFPRGVVRAATDVGLLHRQVAALVGGDSDEETRLRLSLYLRSAFRKATAAESLGMLATFRALQGSRRVVSMPVAVITAAGPAPDDRSLLAKLRPVWLELQADLATLSSDATHVVATSGGHFVHHDDPDVVVDAIRDVVTRVAPRA